MNLEVDVERLLLARKAVRAELLAERAPSGYWLGDVGGSPLATAAAVSALVIAHHPDSDDALRESDAGDGHVIEQLVQGDLSELLVESVNWLARRQNPDGGWADCDDAQSNIAATMLVQAAFRLTGIPASYADLMVRADDYVAAQGGLAGLRRRLGKDKTLLAPILANCALADMVAWRQVPTMPFELLCLPNRWRRELPTLIAHHVTPVVLAAGLAKFHHDAPRNPISRLIRHAVRKKALATLERLQTADDSFLASPLFTAFVVMSLASIGFQEKKVVERGIEFLLSSVRPDASWSITSNMATSNSALALDSFSGEQLSSLPPRRAAQHAGRLWGDTATVDETATEDSTSNPISDSSLRSEHKSNDAPIFSPRCLNWLLECQQIDPHPSTQARPGGWAASDAPGAVPNATATAGALLALVQWRRRDNQLYRDRVERAAGLGVNWLRELQNDDGGWPTYDRDNGLLRFDDSCVDVTAHALRALWAWQREWQAESRHFSAARQSSPAARTGASIEKGLKYLESQQRDDGSFLPSWFGNEHQPGELNPVVGTAQVLMTCGELQRLNSQMAQRAARWLIAAQHTNGGWGPPRAPVDYSNAERDGFRAWRANEAMAKLCTVEETALAVTSLLPLLESDAAISQAASRGVAWLINAIEQDLHRRPAVIGLSLAKIWYHERLYPLVFASGALSRVATLAPATLTVTPVN